MRVMLTVSASENFDSGFDLFSKGDDRNLVCMSMLRSHKLSLVPFALYHLLL